MSEWKFHSARNHNLYPSKHPAQHNNDENSSFNANRMSEVNEAQSVCCISNNISSKYTPIINKPSDPFEARPKIGRTPIVLDINSNDKYKNNFNHQILGQSPVISSYFIRNTPIKYKQHKEYENKENKEEEPGSMIKRRRSSGISISSQPEGIYSPIPKSKILSELNQSINGIECAQSPISLYKDKDKEKEEKQEKKEYISSELSQSIRNEVLAEIEKMDIETSKQIKDNYLLLNPSPSSLLLKMSKLKISDSSNILNTTSNHHHQEIKKIEEKKCIIHNNIKNYDINHNKKEFKKTILIKYCCNKEIWINILNFIWISFVLVLYCNVIDFQWK